MNLVGGPNEIWSYEMCIRDSVKPHSNGNARNEGEKVMAELSPLSWNVIRMKR